MKVYGVVPARAGSERIIDKNITKVGGHPLLAYSIVASKYCDCIDETILTTDSEKYANIGKKYGADEIVMRPESISSSSSPDLDYLLHLIFKKELEFDDIIVLLRPTTPLREKSKILEAVELFSTYDSVRSIHPLNEPPEKMFKFKPNNVTGYHQHTIEPYIDNITMEQANSPSQMFQYECMYPNGYVDILSVRQIIKSKTVYGSDVCGYITEKTIEIDSQDDLDYLNYIVENKNHEIVERINYEFEK